MLRTLATALFFAGRAAAQDTTLMPDTTVVAETTMPATTTAPVTTMPATTMLDTTTMSCGSSGGKTQSGDNNYVIDTFTNVLLFSYAINQCTSRSLFGDPLVYKYTCSEDTDGVWWVTRTSYAEDGCTGTGTAGEPWSNDGLSAGEQYYFKCDGDDNYASLSLSTAEGCGSPINVVGGLGACSVNAANLDTKFYCDSSSALVQLYSAATGDNKICDDDKYFCEKWTFTSTCAKVTNFMGTDVYGTMTTCVADGDSDDESSASSQFTLMGIAIALIVGLFR